MLDVDVAVAVLDRACRRSLRLSPWPICVAFDVFAVLEVRLLTVWVAVAAADKVSSLLVLDRCLDFVDVGFEAFATFLRRPLVVNGVAISGGGRSTRTHLVSRGT